MVSIIALCVTIARPWRDPGAVAVTRYTTSPKGENSMDTLVATTEDTTTVTRMTAKELSGHYSYLAGLMDRDNSIGLTIGNYYEGTEIEFLCSMFYSRHDTTVSESIIAHALIEVDIGPLAHLVDACSNEHRSSR
jgi:hypothetical protein